MAGSEQGLGDPGDEEHDLSAFYDRGGAERVSARTRLSTHYWGSASSSLVLETHRLGILSLTAPLHTPPMHRLARGARRGNKVRPHDAMTVGVSHETHCATRRVPVDGATGVID